VQPHSPSHFPGLSYTCLHGQPPSVSLSPPSPLHPALELAPKTEKMTQYYFTHNPWYISVLQLLSWFQLLSGEPWLLIWKLFPLPSNALGGRPPGSRRIVTLPSRKRRASVAQRRDEPRERYRYRFRYRFRYKIVCESHTHIISQNYPASFTGCAGVAGGAYAPPPSLFFHDSGILEYHSRNLEFMPRIRGHPSRKLDELSRNPDSGPVRPALGEQHRLPTECKNPEC